MNIFSYHKDTNKLVVERSTLEGNISSWKGSPKYFDMRSHHTGKIIRFVYDRIGKDLEGDVQAWIYKPAPSPHISPSLDKLRVVVFND